MATPPTKWLFSCLFVGLVCVLWPLQYATYTDFPLGHEYPNYVEKAIKVQQEKGFVATTRVVLSNSAYPAVISLLAIGGALGVPWQTLMTALTVSALTLLLGSLGYLGYAIGGWKVAIPVTIFATALPVESRHIINGWFAHLFSLPALIALFASYYKGSRLSALLWLGITFLVHPLTGVFSALVIFLAHVLRSPGRGTKPAFVVALVVFFAAIGCWLYLQWPQLDSIGYGSYRFRLSEILTPTFAPLTVLAVYGLMFVLGDSNQKIDRTEFLIAFLWASLLLVFNHLALGAEVLEFRFEIYFLMAIVLLAGISFSVIGDHLSFDRRFLRILPTALLVAFLAFTYQVSAKFYLERGLTYELAILQPRERAGVMWLKENRGNETMILTPHGLAYRWVPAITGQPTTEMPDTWEVSRNSVVSALEKRTDQESMFMIFHRREEIPISSIIFEQINPVFYNSDVIVFKLNSGRE